MTSKPNLPTALLSEFPWQDEKNTIWLSSSLTLLRNLNRFKFLTKLKQHEMEAIDQKVMSSLKTVSAFEGGLSFSAPFLSSLEREWIYEHFFTHDSFQNITPGQSFYIDSKGIILATINFENHLGIQVVENSSDLSVCWSRLTKIESDLSKTLEFAHSPRFGYLTADPAQSGTALLGYIYLHLPALNQTKQLLEIVQKQLGEDVVAFGLEGSLEDLVGDLVILRNSYTLGVTEESILHSLQSAAFKLMLAEKAIRAHFKEEETTTIKDAISRAFGLLMHSYQLQTKEALNGLSLLKLALDLGWVQGTSHLLMNQLFFKCRRAHLSHLFENLSLEEIPRKRAEFIHASLKKLRLDDFSLNA